MNTETYKLYFRVTSLLNISVKFHLNWSL